MNTLACGRSTFLFNNNLSEDIIIQNLYDEENKHQFKLSWEEICIIVNLYKTDDHYDIRTETEDCYISQLRFSWKIADNLIMYTEEKFLFRKDRIILSRILSNKSPNDVVVHSIILQDLLDFVVHQARIQAHEKIYNITNEEILSKLKVCGDKISFTID